MNAKRWTFVLLIAMVAAFYAVPALREERIFWFEPSHHPEYYHGGNSFPFTGYIYPVLLIVLFIAAAVPHVFGISVRALPPSVAEAWSAFSLILLGVIAVLFIIWVVVTPVL